MNFVPGTLVKISNLSKSSYYVYKSYLQYTPLLICPCHVKRDKILRVEDVFDNGLVILSIKGSKALTMTYKSDLEAIYERY